MIPAGPEESQQKGNALASSGDAKADAAQMQAVRAALADPKFSEPGFDSSKVFALMSVLLNPPQTTKEARISSKKRLVRQIGTCYQFVITDKQGKEVRWFADMKASFCRLLDHYCLQKKGHVGKGKPPVKADVTIFTSDQDLVDLATGKANPQKLFNAGRIKIKGNIDSALKVERILSQERSKVYNVESSESTSAVKAAQDSQTPSTTSVHEQRRRGLFRKVMGRAAKL
ncbi:uncharacterized protein L969DRAFT_47620 [Mixia osmundae IAM 14324]|uniref:uncharacterized protein n=1 Tax=Mixia osmundae (strain CBS 9802 / IAM 14324 / JCM 22182 / KY 12970) TaxID=764103 RepID=UPI0004A54E7D|nr:uncharacterized protein L969DRAFT_47620 [Mixia osmundae IAM 14324]KEI40385.1 hypothetical protein L969DRAFT_47620 [Mixia osmundae IAM 14324]